MVVSPPALRAWNDGRWYEDTFAVPNAYPVLVPANALAAGIIAPRSGVARRMYARADHPPGGGGTFLFTLYVNGVVSALQASLIGAAVTGSDLLNAVPVAAGDSLTVLMSKLNTVVEAETVRADLEFA